MPHVKAIIFDIGGTLVKTDDAIIEAVHLALKENNLKIKDDKIITDAFGKSIHHIVKTAVEASYSCKDSKDKSDKLEKCYNSLKQIFPKKVIDKFKLFPKVKEILQLLKEKGIKMGIFTGFNSEEAEFFLQKMGIRKFFDAVVTLDHVKNPRPDPEGLLTEAKELGAEKEECIYVGDAVPDIHMAKNAGIKVVCVKTGVQENSMLEAEEPEYFVEDIDEMVRILKLI